MHHPTDRITHTTAFVTPVVEHWLEREIAQWVHPMKDRLPRYQRLATQPMVSWQVGSAHVIRYSQCLFLIVMYIQVARITRLVSTLDSESLAWRQTRYVFKDRSFRPPPLPPPPPPPPPYVYFVFRWGYRLSVHILCVKSWFTSYFNSEIKQQTRLVPRIGQDVLPFREHLAPPLSISARRHIYMCGRKLFPCFRLSELSFSIHNQHLLHYV